MSNSQTTAQFTEAVAAYQAWDRAIDAYLTNPDAGSSDPVEQATSNEFQAAFTRLCNVRGIYRGTIPQRLMENKLWDDVAAAAEASA